MKFSIIIPTYNRADFIERTIKSVLNQTYTNFEIIVVDDGSTDNTEDVVLSIKDERIRYYKKENEERAVARNYGIKKAIGDYITFLDSDDLFYKNHLEEANGFLKQNDINILFQAYDYQYDNGKIKKVSFKDKSIVNSLLLQKGNIMSCHGVFIKNTILNYYKFVEDRRLSGSEDYELWLRLSKKYMIVHHNTITSILLNHDQRSVRDTNIYALIKRKQVFLNLIKSNNIFNRNELRDIKTSTYLYLSLHLTSIKFKLSLYFLYLAIKGKPWIILSKRVFVILKKIFL